MSTLDVALLVRHFEGKPRRYDKKFRIINGEVQFVQPLPPPIRVDLSILPEELVREVRKFLRHPAAAAVASEYFTVVHQFTYWHNEICFTNLDNEFIVRKGRFYLGIKFRLSWTLYKGDRFRNQNIFVNRVDRGRGSPAQHRKIERKSLFKELALNGITPPKNTLTKSLWKISNAL
jgi:hypothetical protein